MRARVSIACLVALTACSELLGIGDYHDCETEACDGALFDATSGDAQADASSISCAKSAECPAAMPVCSSGVCVSVVSLSRGQSTSQCAVLHDGTARCWGLDAQGQLGDDNASTTWVATPVTVLNGSAPLTNIASIVTGLSSACARTNDSDVYCWGTDPTSPSLGASVVLNGVRAISAAPGTTNNLGTACAVFGDESIGCWGSNDRARMGCTSHTIDDAGVCNYDPQAVAPHQTQLLLDNASFAVGASTYATCAVTGNTVSCWGDALFGAGTGQTVCCDPWTTTFGSGAFTIDSIEPSDTYVCAGLNDGRWFCWGANNGGAILNSKKSLVTHDAPALVSNGTFQKFSPGWAHGCAILMDGTVACWGQNDHNQVGATSQVGIGNVLTPITADGLANVKDVAAHRNFTCAINGDGRVYCWGQNNQGATGWLLGAQTPNNQDVLTPQVVTWD